MTALLYTPPIQAVCLYVKRLDKYLGVSRKGSYIRFGLPAGKVEPGETLLEALLREVKEETGTIPINPRVVFKGDIRSNNVECTAFYADEVEGRLYTEEDHIVAWVTKQELFEGPYGEYNRELFRVVRTKRKNGEL